MQDSFFYTTTPNIDTKIKLKIKVNGRKKHIFTSKHAKTERYTKRLIAASLAKIIWNKMEHRQDVVKYLIEDLKLYAKGREDEIDLSQE